MTNKLFTNWMTLGALFMPLLINAQIGVHYQMDLDKTTRITKFKTDTSNKKRIVSKYPVFKVDDLPLFCKMEYNMEKKTKFPVRFRLGTIDVVDEKEGK